MASFEAPVATDRDALQKWKGQISLEPYRSYLYSYPHKTAYRALEPKLPLADLWQEEAAETFFLYMHIPFCGARCGFCNLFTLPDKRQDVHHTYVDALERQARQWADFTTHKPFARFAIGGGTPTLLAPDLLERLFDIAQNTMGLDVKKASISVETSPETVTLERMNILKERQTDRVSMGIQSFVETEAAAIYRPQKPLEVERALSVLKSYDFPVLNLDLIYGLPGQTTASWIYSLERALAYEPEEIFLYPLYTREHTIVKPGDLAQRDRDIRMSCYVEARDRLLAAGYTQYSMRRFARQGAESGKQTLPYGCQEEGMVGLGCGARSYTANVHYASRYGVSRRATESIIADYVAAENYRTADYGYILNREERQRRFILKAILHREGLALAEYEQRFGTRALEDYPELMNLIGADWAVLEDGVLALTADGMALSDSIGHWLISGEVRAQMEGFVLA